VTHPALIDEAHAVNALFGMVNVPSAVWIDETGRIVRPAETAGSVDAFRRLDRATLQRTDEAAAEIAAARARYLDAVRAWVRTGRHALPVDEVERRTRVPDPLAAVHFRLGQVLHARGDTAGAERHLDEARRRDPANWNVLRQAIALADTKPGQPTPINAMGASAARFWEAIDALGDRPFYPPPQLDGP
jgi:tetratricopeptide (TPR) repeat protein